MTNRKILFVDDEVNILKALQRLLFLENFEVDVTESPEKALQLIRQNDYAVVVSDHRMPSMEGTALLEHTKIISPDSIRILLTGYADLHAATTAINEVGVYKFLSKPWNDTELVEVLKDALVKYEAAMEQKFLRFENQSLLHENLLLTQEKVLQDFESQRGNK